MIDSRGRISFAKGLEELLLDKADEAEYASIRRGWRFGGEEFASRMLERVSETTGNGDVHFQRERQEGMNQKATRTIIEGLEKAGWKGERRKGDPVKVKIAKRLRHETTMTLKWIAEELNMGTWSHVSHLLSKGN